MTQSVQVVSTAVFKRPEAGGRLSSVRDEHFHYLHIPEDLSNPSQALQISQSSPSRTSPRRSPERQFCLSRLATFSTVMSRGLAPRLTAVPIAPRAGPGEVWDGVRRCELCKRAHDAKFGAGRFCSSKCARTVGGLAHRRKRALEREASARRAAAKRGLKHSPKPPSASKVTPSAGSNGPMSIASLLN